MYPMTDEELSAKLALHTWWLNGRGGERLDLRGCNLAGRDLSFKNLRKADLRGCNLQNARLTGACLEEANLEGADLQDAVLTNANLADAILTNADLSGAFLGGAILSDAILDEAVLSYGTHLPTGESFRCYLDSVLPALLTAGGRRIEDAVAVWDCHTWENCPMRVAFGCEEEDVPEVWKPRVHQFTQLHDARLLPRPRIKPGLRPVPPAGPGA